MPTPTYDLIEEQVLGSAQASVTFSSIPGTYKDLVLEAVFASGSATAVEQLLRFNGDTGNNYSTTLLYGTGSAAASSRISNQPAGRFGYTTSAEMNVSILQIMSYANTNVNKTTLLRQGTATAGSVSAYVGLWRSTSAITTVVVSDTNNFASGSVFRLWGVSG